MKFFRGLITGGAASAALWALLIWGAAVFLMRADECGNDNACRAAIEAGAPIQRDK